jgi:hypothetical protein
MDGLPVGPHLIGECGSSHDGASLRHAHEMSDRPEAPLEMACRYVREGEEHVAR